MFETVFDELTWDIHGSKPFTDINEMAKVIANDQKKRTEAWSDIDRVMIEARNKLSAKYKGF